MGKRNPDLYGHGPAMYYRYRYAPLAAGLVYAALVVVVTRAEYWSELAKLRRGVATDTFSPTVFSELVTLPGSLYVRSGLPSYPVDFNVEAYRHVVTVRTAALVEVGLVQALLICLVSVAALLGLRFHQLRRDSSAHSA